MTAAHQAAYEGMGSGHTVEPLARSYALSIAWDTVW